MQVSPPRLREVSWTMFACMGWGVLGCISAGLQILGRAVYLIPSQEHQTQTHDACLQQHQQQKKRQ